MSDQEKKVTLVQAKKAWEENVQKVLAKHPERKVSQRIQPGQRTGAFSYPILPCVFSPDGPQHRGQISELSPAVY